MNSDLDPKDLAGTNSDVDPAALPKPGLGKRRGSARDKGIKMDRAEIRGRGG